MIWIEILWCLLLGTATIRAISTTVRKLTESRVGNGLTWEQNLILKEDSEHWGMACIINALLLSIGVVALFDLPWQDSYSILAFMFFAVLLNVRIERHGYYYRKRSGINVWGNPTQEARERARAAKQMDEVQGVVEDTNRMIREDRVQRDVDREHAEKDYEGGRDHRGYNSGKPESEDEKA